VMPVAHVEGLRIKGGRSAADALDKAFKAYREEYVSTRLPSAVA
jgi:hypothetical protein